LLNKSKKGKGTADLPEPDLACFRKKLLDWYRREGRRLPWRQTHNPYRIWVSEVMLQQTQVATVLPYYRRFIKTLPTVQTLARAPLQQVLKLWEGLGYYARARNLHRAARQVIREWKGKFPSDPTLLQTLPGVGRSTAGAIASLAFKKRAAILDGNLRRVFCRLLAIEASGNSPVIQEQLWDFSERILPRDNAAELNQALMDLGATICAPKKPSCLLCPVRDLCHAFRLGIQERIPLTARRKALPHYHRVVAIIQRGPQVLIIKRAEQGLLGGLWGLAEAPMANPLDDVQQAKRALMDLWGIEVKILQTMRPVEHTFTHLRTTYHPIVCQYASGSPQRTTIYRWVSFQQLSDFPFPAATLKILRLWKRGWTELRETSYSESMGPASLAAEPVEYLTPASPK
jgi:A/G-specific adenine glycosylase